MDDLLQQGIKAYKAGKKDEARKLFISVVKQNPDNERAWERLHDVANNDQERIHCLKQILRINPKNEKAKQLLDTQYVLNGMNSTTESAIEQKPVLRHESVIQPKQNVSPNSMPSFNSIHSLAPASMPQDEQVIKSSTIKTVAAYTIGIACLLFGAWQTINAWMNVSDSLQLGLIFIGFGLYFIGSTLMALQEIILKPEKIILVWNFSEEELTHQQISNITFNSEIQRFGVRAKYVVIYRVFGSSIILNNRLGNPEFLYNTLKNWWEGPWYSNVTPD